jgi:hypothetical protein
MPRNIVLPNPDFDSPRHGWWEWLWGYRWDHVVHLTTRFGYTQTALTNEFIKRFIRRLARKSHQSIAWFYVIEEPVRGHPHLHGLLAGTSCLRIEQIGWAWNAGFSRAQLFSAEQQLRYVIKSVPRSPDSYDFSWHLAARAS